MNPDPPKAKASVVIIGGGIAGLAAARHLTALGLQDVALLEAEPLLASHASARNAGIFLPLEESFSAVWLAMRSQSLLDQRLGTSWLSAQGVVLVSASAEALHQLQAAAHRYGIFHASLGPDEIKAQLPWLASGAARHGVRLPFGGVMDVGRVIESLRRDALRSGAQLLSGARVDEIVVKDARITGVGFSWQGEERAIATPQVVIAAGAWASQLGQTAGADLPLTPLRRHLIQLSGDEMPQWTHPAVWRVDEPVYFRPEAGGVLASPCDETPFSPCLPPSDLAEVAALGPKLSALAPGLSDARVQRSWACLRTMSQDGELVVGPDPRVKGLHWMAGLGGRGMSGGVAAGELLTHTLLGLPHPLAALLSPGRLL